MMVQHDALVDALAAARLEKMHLSEQVSGRASPSWARSSEDRERAWETRARWAASSTPLRVRIGRVLLAAGNALAADEETGHPQRVS